MKRTLKGPNQSRGHLTVVITNNEPVAITASYLETMPWLLQFYLHSLRVTCNGIPAGSSARVLLCIASKLISRSFARQTISSKFNRTYPQYPMLDPHSSKHFFRFLQKAKWCSRWMLSSPSSVIRSTRPMRSETVSDPTPFDRSRGPPRIVFSIHRTCRPHPFALPPMSRFSTSYRCINAYYSTKR